MIIIAENLQPITEQPGQFETAKFAFQSAWALLHNIPGRPGVVFRPVYEENALTPETLPLNTEEETLAGFMDEVRKRGIQPGLSFRPYWNPDLRYDPAEVFGAGVQSLDLHDAPLPRTVLPPEDDVARFIDNIKAAPYPVRLTEQFATALNIAGDDLMGAANLAWIGNRVMARGADQRAYPNIYVDASTVKGWNEEVAQFETYSNSGKNEAPGDNYYFWTHVFGAMAFSRPRIKEKLAQFAFSHGTEIMAFVRKSFSFDHKQPNISEHQPASDMGHAIGLALASPDLAIVSNQIPEED